MIRLLHNFILFCFVFMGLLSFKLYSMPSCDRDELANFYYDINQSGKIDAPDRDCLAYYATNQTIKPGCPTSGFSYYDINWDCVELNGSNCITNDDVELMDMYLDPARKAEALDNMLFLTEAQARRKCFAPPTPPCNADAIAKSLFNFYTTDPALNDLDKECNTAYVATQPFHPEIPYPQCADAHNTSYDYDLDRRCSTTSCVSTNDRTQLTKYINGMKSAEDIPAIADILTLHCAAPPNTPPTLTFPGDGSKYYAMANSNVNQFQMRSVDPDGNDIQFSVTPLPPGAKYSPSGGLVPGPDTELSAYFLWYPISESLIGDHNLQVKANDGTADSNISNVLVRVAAYHETFMDPLNGDAPVPYTISSGTHVFDTNLQVGQEFQMDVELPWLPTPDMWDFYTGMNSCTGYDPKLSATATWSELWPGNPAKARLTFTPTEEPPEGYVYFCPSWSMMSGGGWNVSGLYHKRFRFSFAAGMTLNTSPEEEEQLAYVGEPKVIHLSTTNGSPNYTYNFSFLPASPPATMEMSDPDTYTFFPTAANDGVTYTVTFESTDSTTPIPQTVNKAIKITVTDLKLTEPTLDTFNVNVGGTLNIPLAASGGTPPYTFEFESVPPDPGMSIETTPIDKFMFNPTSTGTYAVTLRVVDNVGHHYDKKVTVNVGTGSNSPPEFILPFEGQHYWLFTGYGYGWEMRGEDPDGCTGLAITATNIPQGPPVGNLALTYESPPSCSGNNFVSDVYFGPKIPTEEAGETYNSTFTVSDGMANDQLNMVISVHAWQRDLFNPLRGGEGFVITGIGERMEHVAKLDLSDWEVGEQIQVEMRYGEVPPTRSWSFNFNNFLPSCVTPSGATMQTISARRGRFTFTPTAPGDIDVCVRVNWNPNLSYMPGQSDLRLYRFNVQAGEPPPDPDLELVLSPANDPQVVFVGESYSNNLSASNGEPPYTFDILGDPDDFSIASSPDRFIFAPLSVADHLPLQVRVTDSASPTPATDIKTINIFSSNLNYADLTTVHDIQVEEPIAENFRIEGGAAPINDPTFQDLTVPPITPAPEMSISGTYPNYIFNFVQNSDLGVGTYTIRLSVNDSDPRLPPTGVTRQIDLTINVAPGDGGGGNPPPGPNEYIVQLEPYILCNKDQILNPLRDPGNPSTFCISPASTLGLVDKPQFVNPTITSTGFNTICFMDENNRRELIEQGLNSNVNDMEFTNAGTVFFERLCRDLNENYKYYKRYIFNVNEDVDADIIMEGD